MEKTLWKFIEQTLRQFIDFNQGIFASFWEFKFLGDNSIKACYFTRNYNTLMILNKTT